jgi:hypothetical protein
VKVLDGLSLGSQQIKNLADGSVASDAATYGQVLNLVNGLDFKQNVRAASTANVTVSAPGASIDGVTLVSGDRVLLKNQTTGSENGVYVFNGAASPLTRATDGVQGELTAAATFVVSEGTNKGTAVVTSAPTQWTLATADPITIGTTALVFNQSGAAGTTYTGTNGVAVAGSVISAAVVASGGISAVAGGLQVDRTKTPQLFASTIGDGSTTSIVVTHNLGTKDVIIALREVVTDVVVSTDWTATSVNTVTLIFAVAPTASQYRVAILG